MKKLILAFVPLFALALIVVPSFPQPQKAETDTQVFDMPFSIDFPVPCANDGLGEQIIGGGNVRVMLSTTVNKNNIHQVWKYNPQGITAVGQTTGTTYHATGVTRGDYNASVSAFPWNNTFVNRFFMISEGPGGNFKTSQTIHVTVNADGATTVNFDDLVFTCK